MPADRDGSRFLRHIQALWENTIAPFYESGLPAWPRRAAERTWFIKSAIDGKPHRVSRCDEEALGEALLELHPVRIRYSATAHGSTGGPWFETPFWFKTPEQALQAVRLLRQDFGINLEQMRLSRLPHHVQLVAEGPPLQDAPRHRVQSALDYLGGRGFHPSGTDESPRTRLQHRFREHVEQQLSIWCRLDRPHLAYHLAAKTDLGHRAPEVAAWLTAEPRSLEDLDCHPALKRLAFDLANRRLFPRPNLDKTLQSPRIQWVGSFDHQLGPIKEIPLTNTHRPQE